MPNDLTFHASPKPQNCDVAEIQLSQGHVAIIDAEDLSLVSIRKWSALNICGKVYAKNRDTYLHRLILNAPNGASVKFRDGNPLNCRRSNLTLSLRSRVAAFLRATEGGEQ